MQSSGGPRPRGGEQAARTTVRRTTGTQGGGGMPPDPRGGHKPFTQRGARKPRVETSVRLTTCVCVCTPVFTYFLLSLSSLSFLLSFFLSFFFFYFALSFLSLPPTWYNIISSCLLVFLSSVSRLLCGPVPSFSWVVLGLFLFFPIFSSLYFCITVFLRTPGRYSYSSCVCIVL